jgi:PIN domain nuclease of toxin-antitoxin system
VKILLDTQCWLWMLVAPERFSTAGAQCVSDPENDLHLSAASAWEIAIKHAIGRLRLPVDPAEYVRSRLAESRTIPLPISHEHALHVAGLPLHHRDPFDRLLVAQAQLERLSIMTADPHFAAYDVEVIRI